MKKQTITLIRTRLFQAALLLSVLFLALHVVPRALAQRTGKEALNAEAAMKASAQADVPLTKRLPAMPATPQVCTLNGTLGTAPAGGATGTLSPRLFRPATAAATCAVPTVWPGSSAGSYLYNVHYITNNTAAPLCTNVTLHYVSGGTATVNIQHGFFQAPFAPGDMATAARYLADPEGSSGSPPVDLTFGYNVPAGATVALVVWSANASPQGQGAIYQLNIDQDAYCGPPAPSIAANGSSITAEGCNPPNMAIDPGEAVTVSLGLKNNGGASTTNLVATLQATGGVTNPSGPVMYGVIAPTMSANGSFTFTADGSLTCGSVITATLTLSNSGNPLPSVTFTFTTGTLVSSFTENFDSAVVPALPAGWTADQGTNAAGAPMWVTSNAGTPTPVSDTAPNAVFTQDAANVLDNRLYTPSLMYSAGSMLFFRQNYDLEMSSATVAYDAGVLEMSVNGGAYQDILTAGGTFAQGGYNHTDISTGFANPLLPTRPNWSGISNGGAGGFEMCAVNLPAAAAGMPVQFRWRMGSDNSVSHAGWRVDTVSIAQRVCCGTTCTNYFGLCHTPLGQAMLSTNANGDLIIGNLGSSGQDGVSIALGDSEGFSWDSNLDTSTPIGAYARSAFMGTVSGMPNQQLGGSRITRLSDGFDFEHDFQADSTSPTYTIQVFNGGYLVYTRDFTTPTGPPGAPIFGRIWKWILPNVSIPSVAVKLHCKGSSTHTQFGKDKTWDYGASASTSATVVAGGASDVVTGNLFVLTLHTPGSPALFNNGNLVAAGMSQMILLDEGVGLFGFTFQVRGGCVLRPQNTHFTVSNIGSSGQDGVSIDFGKVQTFDAFFDPLDPSGTIPNGAFLQATAFGSLNNVPDQPLGILRTTKTGANNYAITADFTAIGSPTQHIQVYNQGNLVANFTGHTGPVGTSSKLPISIGKLGGQLECFVSRHPFPTDFIISGFADSPTTTYTGDELRVLAEGSSQTINFKSGLELLAASIPEIDLTNVQAVQIPELVSVVSRRIHGGAGAFDILLPLTGTSGVECRGVSTLVFTFNKNAVSGNAAVTAGIGSVSGAPAFNGNEMTVNLTGVANAQAITVTLSNVVDVDGLTLPTTSVSMGVLQGDVNGNRSVNASDAALTKSRVGQAVNATNFRSDVNASGTITASDVAQVKANAGHGLP